MSQEVTFKHTKIFTFTGRNLLSQEEIFTGRNLMTQVFSCRFGRHFFSRKLTSCHKKKFSVTGRNLLSQEEIYCCSKKYLSLGINFVELGIISPQKMNFLPKKEMYCHRKKLTVKGSSLW